MTIETVDGCTVITGESINTYRLLALRSALKLECVGLKSRKGANVPQQIRDILTANKYIAPRKKDALLRVYEYFLKKQGLIGDSKC